MNANEPVFWTCGLEEDEAVSNALKIKLGLEYYNIPLYTHPVKELTDEEIHQVIFNLPNKDLDLIEFARAILRKAQEK
jgi:hypothetical protein